MQVNEDIERVLKFEIYADITIDYYEDDGTIVGIGEFNKGSGTQKSWYRHGTLKRVINYQENEKHGKETWYDAQGQVTKIVTFEFGSVIKTEKFSN